MTRDEELQALKQLKDIHAWKVKVPMTLDTVKAAVLAGTCLLFGIAWILHQLGL